MIHRFRSQQKIQFQNCFLSSQKTFEEPSSINNAGDDLSSSSERLHWLLSDWTVNLSPTSIKMNLNFFICWFSWVFTLWNCLLQTTHPPLDDIVMNYKWGRFTQMLRVPSKWIICLSLQEMIYFIFHPWKLQKLNPGIISRSSRENHAKSRCVIELHTLFQERSIEINSSDLFGESSRKLISLLDASKAVKDVLIPWESALR